MVAQFQSQYNYATNWQRRLNEISNATLRDRILLAMMQAAGCIKRYTGGGEFCEFNIKMRNPKPEGYSDYVPPNYSQPDSYRTARLPWSAYHHGKHLGRLKLNMNQGAEQAINIFTSAMEEVDESFRGRWPEYFYQNGDSPPLGESNPMHGFYTLFDKYVNSTAAASQGYMGRARLLSGTYAGLTIDLGTESGTFQGDDGAATVQAGTWAGYNWWPNGQGDPAYDYMHPLIVNTTAGAAATPVSWGANAAFNSLYWQTMLDWGMAHARRLNGGARKGLNLILCGVEPHLVMQEGMQSTYRTMTRIVMDSALRASQDASPVLMETGFNVGVHNGAVIAQDFDMPNTTDLLGLRLTSIQYQPVNAYDGRNNPAIMQPYQGQAPGGGGELIGGFSHGQLVFFEPRNMVAWRPLG